MREGKGDWWWHGENELLAKQIERLQAEIAQLREIERLYKAGTEHWNPVYQVVLKERDELRAQLTEAAVFLDRMAHRMETLWVEHGVSDKKAATDCRAMAEKLRK